MVEGTGLDWTFLEAQNRSASSCLFEMQIPNSIAARPASRSTRSISTAQVTIKASTGSTAIMQSIS